MIVGVGRTEKVGVDRTGKVDGRSARTMQDVANSLGVSVSTVSLALAGNAVVAQTTRDRVQDEAERLGYVYNRSAANLRTQRRHLVGFVVPDIANPFVAESALRLQEVVSERGQFVVLANTQEDLASQTAVLQALAEERAAGVVLIPAIGTTAGDLSILDATGMPLVLMNRPVEQSGHPYVGADDHRVIDLALSHLLDVHRVGSVAYFGGLDQAGPWLARKSWFDSAVTVGGAEQVAAWSTPTGPNPSSAYEQASALIARCPPPAGLVCHSDSIAIGVIRAFNEAGIGPGVCKVVGIDGIAQSAMVTPTLTTVSVHPGGIGMAAGQLLLANSGTTEIVAPPPTLTVRASCGCAPGR